MKRVIRLVLLILAGSRVIAAQSDPTPVIRIPNPPNVKAQQAKHYVVLVSLDGFRYDYPREYGTPNLDQIAKNGVSTPEGMYPSYPSVTFPNHYTLVTGLRPEHHGIVANKFYDPDRDASYSMSGSEAKTDGTWYGGMPLWVLAEQQGMRSAPLFWPGAEAAILGVRASFYLHFDDKLDDRKRIDQVIAWLKLPEAERPHFITLYYSDADHAGHDFGPDSPQEHDAVKKLDGLIGELRDRLHATGLPVDLIVTADHGMAKLGEPIILDKFANLDNFTSYDEQIYAKTEADAEKAYDEFRAHPDPRFTAYRRLDVPKELDYNASIREGDPVIVTHGPYAVYAHPPKKYTLAGSHGFPPHQVPQMKAIFFAEGPDIRAGVRLKSFDNVDVFPFVVHLLGLEAPKVDGTLAPLAPALKSLSVPRLPSASAR
jgi:predicted AlkP superfamily pyrophosphatase or phosphodiesterase